MHYLRALDHAERAGDVLQVIRIRANRGSLFLEEGYYSEAIAELDAAIGQADLAGFASLRALALMNRGEVARRLGRLDDAARTVDEIAERLREVVYKDLRRRGAVVGLSGGVDSSLVAFLCVRAFGAERVLGVLMPEGESASDTLDLSNVAAEAAGVALSGVRRDLPR